MWKRLVLLLTAQLALGTVAIHADGGDALKIPPIRSLVTTGLVSSPHALHPAPPDCLSPGACRTPAPAPPVHAEPEEYPDGLRWGSGPASLKFSGNRVKFRLVF